MNQAIEHRGPDGNDIWTSNDKEVLLGHQRLSILDLSSNGKQPMMSPSGNVITYNGEIYNFKSLRKQLPRRSFRSQTDTEVLLYLYEESPETFLNDLNGMFAFAIWDEKNSRLILARDRIGIKPLYYSTQNGIFAFSSEIKSLLTLPWINPKLDEEAFYDFLTFGNLHPPQTLFEGIHKFHPGYKMIVKENGIAHYEPFWEVTYSNHDKLKEQDVCSLIVEELEKSVELRMVSDVPVGAFLSGGVDSSAIVALAGKKTSKKIRTFSIGFEGAPDYDELKYARKISDQFGTEHSEKIVTPQDMIDFLPKIVDIYDEPLIDATSIPIYFISQMARESGTYVILTGDGPDELFLGYRSWLPYLKMYPYYKKFLKLPSLVRSSCNQGSKMFLNANSPLQDILYRASKGQELFWGGARGFKESTKKNGLKSGVSWSNWKQRFL